jgi:hypothetical protein
VLKGRRSKGEMEPNKCVRRSEALPHLGGKRFECACGVRRCELVWRSLIRESMWCGRPGGVKVRVSWCGYGLMR